VNELVAKLQHLFEEGKNLIESGCWGAVWGVDCPCAERRDKHGNYLPNDYEHLPECRVYKWREGMNEVLSELDK